LRELHSKIQGYRLPHFDAPPCRKLEMMFQMKPLDHQYTVVIHIMQSAIILRKNVWYTFQHRKSSFGSY